MRLIVKTEKEFISEDLQQKAVGNEVYSTMVPIESPKFASIKEVIKWYDELKPSNKLQFISSGHIVIYAHRFVEKTRPAHWGDYIFEKGEIVSTNEAAEFDFAAKDWLFL